MYTCLEFLFTIFMMVSKCRFVVGMERQSYSEFGFCPGHGNFVNGSWSLRAYLVAPWHGIPFCGCDPFSKHTCKYLCKYFILHLFNHRKIFMCLLLHIIFFLLMRFIIEIWAGLAKCNYKTHKRVHETEKSIGCSPCSPSRCNIWRATSLWWWMCDLQGMLSCFIFFTFWISFSVFDTHHLSENVRNLWPRLKDYTAVTYFIFHAWDLGMVILLNCLLFSLVSFSLFSVQACDNQNAENYL